MQWLREFEMPNPSLCDELVRGFKKARELGFSHEGLSARGLDKSWKDSEDASLTCLPFDVYATSVRAYREHVMKSLQAYCKAFPILTEKGSSKLGFLEPPQIQFYKPGGGFYGAHYESSGLDITHRVLAFQTYLNDIKEGGGTEFLYQQHVVQPKKGKTVIWPAGFTHTHRGVVAPKEEKYVITGWISFIGG